MLKPSSPWTETHTLPIPIFTFSLSDSVFTFSSPLTPVQSFPLYGVLVLARILIFIEKPLGFFPFFFSFQYHMYSTNTEYCWNGTWRLAFRTKEKEWQEFLHVFAVWEHSKNRKRMWSRLMPELHVSFQQIWPKCDNILVRFQCWIHWIGHFTEWALKGSCVR